MTDTFIIMDLQFFANEGDKTEQPTSKKLTDAREEGNVAKSQEIGTAFLFILVFVMLKAVAPYMIDSMLEIFNYSFSLLQEPVSIFNAKYLSGLIVYLLGKIILIAAPLFLGSMVVGIIANLIQVGWHPTTKPLKPKFSNLNPMSGFKRMFSARSIVELLKSLAKIGMIAAVFYGDLMSASEHVFDLMNMGLVGGMTFIGNVGVNLGLKTGFFMLFIAAADYGYTKYKHIKDLKMTKQEVKDEYKNTEGDPQIKGKIRQKMREVSMSRMMQGVPSADVVITNPTHFAVAIKYDKSKAEAPFVIAKGADFLAKRIKEKAKENNVEIVENKPLARALYNTVEVNQVIPEELYQAVAEILAFVYNMKNK